MFPTTLSKQTESPLHTLALRAAFCVFKCRNFAFIETAHFVGQNRNNSTPSRLNQPWTDHSSIAKQGHPNGPERLTLYSQISALPWLWTASREYHRMYLPPTRMQRYRSIRMHHIAIINKEENGHHWSEFQFNSHWQIYITPSLIDCSWLSV